MESVSEFDLLPYVEKRNGDPMVMSLHYKEVSVKSQMCLYKSEGNGRLFVSQCCSISVSHVELME